MNPGPLGPKPTMITTRPPPGRTGCYVLKFRFLCLLIPDDLKKSESFFCSLNGFVAAPYATIKLSRLSDCKNK